MTTWGGQFAPFGRTQATPTQLAFGRDALLNISFEADWQCIKKRKQHRIIQNNKAENATRREHTYNPGDQVMVKADPSRKLEGERWIGPCTVTQVFEDNGTLQLTRNAPTRGGWRCLRTLEHPTGETLLSRD